MNQLIFALYIADVIPAIGIAFVCIGLLGLLVAFIGLVGSIYEDHYDLMVRFCKRFAPAMLCLILLGLAIPSKTFFYTAIALKVGETTIETEVGQKAIQLIEQQLDEWLGEVTP